MLKKSMSHLIFLVSKFGFTPVDTYTLKLTGIGPQKIPRSPPSAITFNFTCNVLSVQQGSLEPFFSDTINSHLHIKHVPTPPLTSVKLQETYTLFRKTVHYLTPETISSIIFIKYVE